MRKSDLRDVKFRLTLRSLKLTRRLSKKILNVVMELPEVLGGAKVL